MKMIILKPKSFIQLIQETRFVRAKGYIMNHEISRLTEVMKEAKYLFSIDYDYYNEKADESDDD